MTETTNETKPDGAASAVELRVGRRVRKDRDWRDYQVGTKAHAYTGGAWLRTERGWQWNGHCTDWRDVEAERSQRLGADAIGECVELPHNK